MTVSIEIQNDVAVIGIDDGKKNVINHDVLDQLEAAFDKADEEGARAILFKGREGSFCAGYDISVMTGDDPDASSRLGKRGGLLAKRIFASPVPVVGLSQGHGFTIGAVWLACCDVAIGEEGAFKYGMTEVALNVPLSAWALEPLRAKLNASHHIPALLHSTIYPPDGALQAGFIDKLVPEGEGFQAAMTAAAALAELPSHAYAATKLAMRKPLLDIMTAQLG